MRSDRAALTDLRAGTGRLIGPMVALMIGCGNTPGANGPNRALVTIHGHVDLSAISDQAKGAPLLAGLIWGTEADIPALCEEYSDNAIVQTSCPDPAGFYPGAVDATVPIDSHGTGDFALPIQHLPPASALMGVDPLNDAADGTVVVVADTNHDGQIELLTASQTSVSGNTAPMGEVTQDMPLAASYVTVDAPGNHVAFRQGPNSPGEYPCIREPTGYSILEMTPPSVGVDPTCKVLGLNTTVKLTPLTSNQAQAFACRALTGRRLVLQPDPMQAPSGLLLDTASVYCPSYGILMLYGQSNCPFMTVYSLAGCPDDPQCGTPKWNESMSVPKWWPCGF